MEEALELARAKDTKERMAGVEHLHQLLEASRKSLSSSEVTALVDCCMDLLKDNNFRISQGALQALASAAVLSGEHLKLHFNALVPAAVERLGDAKQPVRDAARRLLLTLMEVSSPTIIVERAGSYAWTHKSWRVREEFARTVTSAIGLFASTELPLQRALFPPNEANGGGGEGRSFAELQKQTNISSCVECIPCHKESRHNKMREAGSKEMNDGDGGRILQQNKMDMKPSICQARTKFWFPIFDFKHILVLFAMDFTVRNNSSSSFVILIIVWLLVWFMKKGIAAPYLINYYFSVLLQEMYKQSGPQFRDELQRHQLPTSLVKDINARLEKIEPKINVSDAPTSHFIPLELKPTSLPSYKRNSPKAKNTVRESSLLGGESDVTEKLIDPIKVYSEKELIREIEKIASTLVPEKDWSLRIAAMQRVEGLVFGGALDYPSFTSLLKQLVAPLSTQLSDRRSSIVKQACHLLSLLSKELLGDFEACAEMFIPVLFKLVVITVLVIAESADNCIKTMLRNCKVARVLPRIADCAKNDRSAVLRARCCEYALLILECWADAPDVQRSADLYEDFIKCCVADAMSEFSYLQFYSHLIGKCSLQKEVTRHTPIFCINVIEQAASSNSVSTFLKTLFFELPLEGRIAHLQVRSTARTCYRMFTKTWPERSRRLFSSFDPAIQRLINEEDGGMHRRYASPSLRERGVQIPRTQSQIPASSLSGYGTSAIVAMDRTASITSGTSLSSAGLLLSQVKPTAKVGERSLESMLHASKQKVTAIESMLRGVASSEKLNSSAARSTSLDLGVDPPSARDPPFPPAVPATDHLPLRNSALADSAAGNIARGGLHNGGSSISDIIIPPVQASKEPSKASYLGSLNNDVTLSLPFTARRSMERLQVRSSVEEDADIRPIRRFTDMQIDKRYPDSPYKDASIRVPHNSHIPNFQRPLLRKNVAGRMPAVSRNTFDDSQLSMGDMSSYVDGPVSLSEALSEGLSSSSDWSARVSAFNFLRTLLQQGPKGIQEVTQSFEKVMKLFFQHLDDPHHKVAQAALLTLAEVIPACRKPFESYIERILPHVFSRLIDPKELVRQPCSKTLEIVGKTYSIESLLPALLRSLDEQRSPKAKLAVIEFAIKSFKKQHTSNSDGVGNSGFLKLWLAKLAPLVNDKNTKLKEAAITCIISIYTYFDSVSVLNFITSLSVEEQNLLRRALKQYTPRIEVDLVNFLQSKKERQRSKSFYDQSDAVGSSSEENFVGTTKKNHLFGRYSSGSVDSDCGKKWNSLQESTHISGSVGKPASDEIHDQLYLNLDNNVNSDGPLLSKSKDQKPEDNSMMDYVGSWATHPEKLDHVVDFESYGTSPHTAVNGLHGSVTSDELGESKNHIDGFPNLEVNHKEEVVTKNNSAMDGGVSIPKLLHQICDGSDENSAANKRRALQQLVDASVANDHSMWTKRNRPLVSKLLINHMVYTEVDREIEWLVGMRRIEVVPE
ncbi:hypothetical protein ACLOJK_011164 [Asimina triloba]